MSCFYSGEDILTDEEYFELCPYELKLGREHVLQVPITMRPHQMIYQVGDTLTVRMHFSDWIYDLSRETAFKIENFPFEPATLLYRINGNSTWSSGYNLNEVIVDEKYNPRFNPQSNRAADMRGFAVYEDEHYSFEYKLVLTTPGRYVTVITDQYEINLFGDEERNAKTDSIQFEGRCPQSPYRIVNVLEDDPHHLEFVYELLLLDNEVHRGGWQSNNPALEAKFGGGDGFLNIEWIGVYCFQVVE